MDDSSTILLLEDNHNDIELTLAALREGVAKEVFLGNEEEALDYLSCRSAHRSWAAENPVAVLLDFKPPTLDGLEALQGIKTDPDLKSMRVAMLASSWKERGLLRGYNIGTKANMIKSMSFRVFIETIREVGLFWADINQPPSAAEREL